MAPCNMRCKTCGEYIYKGKKFNARKEDVEGEDYLGIRIFRFYIKCTRCLQEISFKTDPRNTDYEIEAGATRNFMALKLAEEQAQREEDERKEEEANNPMKLLENRTQQSKQELELLESLEELKDLNRRQRTIDYDSMLSNVSQEELQKRLEKQQEEDDEKFIKSIYGQGNKRVLEEEIIEEDDEESPFVSSISQPIPSDPPRKVLKTEDIISEQKSDQPLKAPKTASFADSAPQKKVGIIGGGVKKNALVCLVKPKSSVTAALSSSEKKTPLVQVVSSESEKPPATDATKESGPAKNGLSLLCSYSGSETDSE